MNMSLGILFMLYLILFIASAIIGLVQFFGVLGFDNLTAPLYSKTKSQYLNIRMFGTFIATGALFSVGMFFYEKKFWSKVILGIFFLILFWVLALTESRTALVTLFRGIFAFISAYYLLIKKKVSALLKTLIGFIILFSALFLTLDQDLISRFGTILNFMEDLSLQMRLFAWYANLNLFLQSFLFGYGPAFHQFTPTVDSDYIFILRRYGIVGSSIYSLIYLYPIRLSLRGLSEKNIYSIFKLITFSGIIIFLIENITNPLFHEMQFMGLWAILFGLLFSIKK